MYQNIVGNASMSSQTNHERTHSYSYAGHMPKVSSPIVQRLLDAHGVVLGKARMHELAYDVTTINPFFGPVLNPYNNLAHVGGG